MFLYCHSVGMPGTGKTATVREVLRELQNEVYQQKLKKFNVYSSYGFELIAGGYQWNEACQSFSSVLSDL